MMARLAVMKVDRVLRISERDKRARLCLWWKDGHIYCGHQCLWVYVTAVDGSIYFLRREESGGDLEINIPPSLSLPANPAVGQTWTNGSRELEVLDLNGTSPNGITGCIVVRETSDNFIDTTWFKDRVIIAIREQDPDGIDPDEVLYRTGP